MNGMGGGGGGRWYARIGHLTLGMSALAMSVRAPDDQQRTVTVLYLPGSVWVGPGTA